MLTACYWLIFCVALLHTGTRGYPWLATGLGAVYLLMCLRSPGRPLTGSVLAWRAGRWSIEYGVVRSELTLQRAHCLPWVTYLQWRESDGSTARVWLFNDSVDREQLRRLRVRLQLERGI